MNNHETLSTVETLLQHGNPRIILEERGYKQSSPSFLLDNLGLTKHLIFTFSHMQAKYWRSRWTAQLSGKYLILLDFRTSC